MASGNKSSIVGGQINTASADSSFVGGGKQNFASGNCSFIGGGSTNRILGGSGGNAGGGFSGAYGQDNSNQTGCGASFVNDNNKGNVSVVLATGTNGVFQDSNFTTESQMNGWVYVEFVG